MASAALPYFSPETCVGREPPSLVELEPGGRHACHAAAWPVWQALVAAAAEAGIELAAVSAYRGFAQQEVIWNAKWRGERAVLGVAWIAQWQ